MEDIVEVVAGVAEAAIELVKAAAETCGEVTGDTADMLDAAQPLEAVADLAKDRDEDKRDKAANISGFAGPR